ncbi:MAG: 2Fe-2S iron-sulfur cluster binding domain-containing protein [Methylotenera sp.]|nr:2Fe-2S iron-sulfur cluster binding domain-containing protein [Methylotenera sp.]NOT65448.1 2Fe-2S iron-sulfur cluster binding domain-containing protein [Methylotenera sp.]
MPTLSFEGKSVTTLENEKVLEAFLRVGINIPFSCRNGVCHSCKCIAQTGEVPQNAQKGLSTEQREQGFFLPCLCVPTENMVILPVSALKVFTTTIVQGKTLLANGDYQLLLEPTLTSPSSCGQLLNLRLSNNEVRNVSITNQPSEDYFIEVQIACSTNDATKQWLATLAIDDALEIQGPYDADTVNSVPDPVAAAIPRAKYPPPDATLWTALQEGKLLMVILKDFYGRVYQDPLLSPYFHGTTMLRSIEKVYSFMHQVCTGEHTYFGERPKNSHHWMVISDETFNYREALMMECHRRAGLSDEMSQRWMAIERHYKQDIIKDAPLPRSFGNTVLPLDGYGEMMIEVGSMCDGCGRVVEPGEHIRYHLRLGTLYCGQCNGI